MGHTKTAVSLPDELFRRLEERAAEEGAPRSAIVALALEQYLNGLSAAEFVRRMNEAWSGDDDAETNELRDISLAAAREGHLRMLAEEDEPWES